MMATFGSTTLPHVLNVERRRTRILSDRPIVGDEVGYHDDFGGGGRTVVIRGEIRGTSPEATRAAIEALADGVARTLIDDTGLTSFNAIMLTPRFVDDVQTPGRLGYELTFMEK